MRCSMYYLELMTGWVGSPQILGPNRLVVRTTRCGRVDPGSNPGSDILEVLPALDIACRGNGRGDYKSRPARGFLEKGYGVVCKCR